MERESKDPITIKLNSQGGDVYEALAMVDRIADCPAPIIVKCYGTCQSASVLILACADERYMGKHAWAMHHESNYEISRAPHAEVKEVVDQVEREEEQWSLAMAEFSNQPAEFWRDIAHKFNFYLTADECLAYEIIDGIL